MTAPLFFVPRGSLGGRVPSEVVALEGTEGRHAATVMRLGPGEQVLLSDGAGLVAAGAVLAAAKDRLEVRIGTLTEVERPSPRFVLVQALAKGDRDELAVETATELGVDVVVPWQASRCVVQWRGERGEKARRKWESTALAAAKQSRRALVPEVEPLVDTRALVRRVAQEACVVVLHEEGTARLQDVALPDAGDVLVVVGPEGGIAPDELAALAGAGAYAVRLGEHVLRASTAGPAAISALSLISRW